MRRIERFSLFGFSSEISLLAIAIIIAGSATASSIQVIKPTKRITLIANPISKLSMVTTVKPVTATKVAPLSQTLLPSKDNTYSLGSSKFR